MLAPDHRSVVVFACGEPLRGDDGIAHAAVDGLAEHQRHGVAIRHLTALGPEDLAGIDPGAIAIVVDAVVGIPVGDIVRFDLEDLAARPTMRPTSSHQLPLDMVIGLAKLMGWHPRGAFIGVGAARFDHGHALSPELARMIPLVVESVAAEIDRAVVRERWEATLAAEEAPEGVLA
jgi:hydrogenase maturation protease